MIYIFNWHLKVGQELLLQIIPFIIYPQVVIKHIELTCWVTQLSHWHNIDWQGEHIIHGIQLQLSLPVINYGSLQTSECLTDAFNLFSWRCELLYFLNALNGFTVRQVWFTVSHTHASNYWVVIHDVLGTAWQVWLINNRSSSIWSLGLKVARVIMMVFPSSVSLNLKWVQAVSVQTLVFALVHANEWSARGEVEVLTDNELLVDSQVCHDIWWLHLLDKHALLYEQPIFFFILYCIHCKYLVIKLITEGLIY